MSRRGKLWVAILIVAAIVRTFALSAYPSHDTTEAHYVEVARIMPASFELLGLKEFSARLPSLLLTFAVVLLIYDFARKTLTVDAALGASAIFLTSAIGFVAAGAVMTDALLLLGTTLSMVAFLRAVIWREQRWRYLFFLGIAIGLLSKGPVALVLTAFPVGLWLLCNRSMSFSALCPPWVPGLLVILAVAAPWYVIAELRTPGYLQYFFVGEHGSRYLESGWQGDLYGTADTEPRGTIWLFGIAAAFPWSLVALYAVGRSCRTWSVLQALTPLQTYLILWATAPLIVFSFAGNVLPAYVLPGIPAFAILLSNWLGHQSTRILHVAWFVPLLITAVLLWASFEAISDRSQDDLIANRAKLARPETIVCFPSRPFSAVPTSFALTAV